MKRFVGHNRIHYIFTDESIMRETMDDRCWEWDRKEKINNEHLNKRHRLLLRCKKRRKTSTQSWMSFVRTYMSAVVLKLVHTNIISMLQVSFWKRWIKFLAVFSSSNKTTNVVTENRSLTVGFLSAWVCHKNIHMYIFWIVYAVKLRF